MKAVHPTTGRDWIEPTGETGLRTRGLITERQRVVHEESGQLIGISGLVLGSLGFHTGESAASFLGLDHTHSLTVDVQDIISRAGFRRHFAYRDTPRSSNRRVLVILHDPAA